MFGLHPNTLTKKQLKIISIYQISINIHKSSKYILTQHNKLTILQNSAKKKTVLIFDLHISISKYTLNINASKSV